MKKLALLFFLSLPSVASSRPELKLGGIFDFYYLYSPGRGQEGVPLPNRNYDVYNNDFTISLLEINALAEYKSVSLYVDLDFGSFAEQNLASSSAYDNVGQAFLTYQINDKFKLIAGKMFSHVGYESPKAVENWNYSRSFSFSFATPNHHEGLALSYETGNGLKATGYIYDTWDTSVENNSEKSYGFQVLWEQEKYLLTLNFLTGHERRVTTTEERTTVIEANAQYSLNPELTLAFNGVMGSTDVIENNIDQEWMTFVLYANWKLNPKWSLTPRVEFFMEGTDDNATSGNFIFDSATIGNDVHAFTLTGTFHCNEHNEFRLEYRLDSADEALYLQDDGSSEDSRSTLSISWLLRI